MPHFDVHIKSEFFEHFYKWWRFERCRQRLLVVTDGLNFNAGDGFGLTVFLGELAKSYPTPFITTKLHDSTMGAFKFDDGSVTINNYDQIWLFGSSGPALTPTEITAIADFMAHGGGVFATGDHATLGEALCGSIPRVRGMREWSTVPMEIGRIDTVTQIDPADTFSFDDQSDAIPQHIHPVFTGSGSSWVTHPLLRATRTIDVLPDHPHESVCYGGANTAYQGDFSVIGGSTLLPEVIAYSVSAGRYLGGNKLPTTPQLFGAISAYDGHQAGHGRIVTDATWHHFVNINLDGTGSGRLALQSAPGTFTTDFQQIARYYRNILDWIAPANRQWCLRWITLLLERYLYPLREEFIPLPHPCPWEPRVALGSTVEAALEARHGSGAAYELVDDALRQADLANLADIARPRRDDQDKPVLINPHELRQGILGSIADELLSGLPWNPYEVGEIDDHDDGDIHVRVLRGVRSAADAAADHYRAAAERTATLF
jgi:hypothetical protein